LFLSRLHPIKGIVDRLLPAVAAMRRPCFLAIVGPEDIGAPRYKLEIKKAVHRLDLDDRVAMLGPVTGNKRWALYDGASIFVLPSHSESFGIVVAEAMARSCPVVVSKEVQSSKLVEQAGAGLVVDGEGAELAAALDLLLSDENRRRTAGSCGYRFAYEQLQWSSVAERLKAMYCEILAAA
jgi:glycosyltransferase involved in cell wall biosynthesis